MYGGEYGGILLGLGLCLVLAVVFAGYHMWLAQNKQT